MTRNQHDVLLVDTNGLNPYGRCLALALREAGVTLDFHRRRAAGISGFGRPFGPTRERRGRRWLRALALGASLARLSLHVRTSRLVHVLWETRADLLLAAFAKVIWRRPVVVTIHDAGRPGKRNDRTLRLLATLADRIVVLSSSTESELISRVPSAQNKIDVVPLLSYSAHAQDGNRERVRLQIGLPPDSVLVLFFGHLRAGKGLETLIQSADEFLPAAPRARLVIAGSDPEGVWGDQLQALQARNPDQVILFVSEDLLSEQMLNELVLAADLVALPFTRAAQSSSAILALAYRRPVVTTAVGAVSDLGSAGAVALVTPGDAKELADTCLRLIGAPRDRDELAHRGFVYVSTELSPIRIAAKTVSLYELSLGTPIA